MSASKGSAGNRQPVDGVRRTAAPSSRSPKQNLSEARRKQIARDLESMLSSVMVASDKELGHITREIDEVADAARRDGSDNLTERLHPVLWSALKQVILERELRNLALTDDLTCLYNRRGFFAAATQQIKTARRNMQSMLLTFYDIDNLKQINDFLGRREGDFALVRMADVLEETYRDSDVLARLGGDEFAVLALGTSDFHEDSIARRFNRVLDRSNATEPRYQISVSCGHARFDPHFPVELSELITQADRAMRKEKASSDEDLRIPNHDV